MQQIQPEDLVNEDGTEKENAPTVDAVLTMNQYKKMLKNPITAVWRSKVHGTARTSEKKRPWRLRLEKELKDG